MEKTTDEIVSITIQDIVGVFKNTNEKKRLKEIKAAIVTTFFTKEGILLSHDQEEIEK